MMTKRVSPALIALGVSLAALIYCIAMAMTQGFAVRCERAGYAPDTAAHERCVSRLNNDGPVFEENIGLIHK